MCACMVLPNDDNYYESNLKSIKNYNSLAKAKAGSWLVNVRLYGTPSGK